MKKKYRIYQVDSFTKEIFTGNPAGVVPNADGLTETMMQKIARELNHSETAFVFTGKGDEYDVHVRFFTPKNEVPICGHATIAAHYVRAIETKMKSGVVRQKTGAGILPVEISQDGQGIKIIMTQGEVSVLEPLAMEIQNDIIKALGVSIDKLRQDCPIAIASTGHSKVMVGITDINLLHHLEPDMAQLSQISSRIGSNGFYVFTLHPQEEVLVHGRMFAPAIGISEDPVTGNANGPLGAYLVHYGLCEKGISHYHFRVIQGEAMGRAGGMEVFVDLKEGKAVKVKISGDAVIAFWTEVEIDI
jgi:PhzF family phenazine biosynthesis protein